MNEGFIQSNPENDRYPERQLLKYLFGLVLTDYGAMFLVAGNFLAVVSALVNHWSVALLLWLYFVQSIMTAVFALIRILKVPEADLGQMTILGKEQPARKVPLFLLLAACFGIFYSAMAVMFLFAAGTGASAFWAALRYDHLYQINIALFCLSQLFSFITISRGNAKVAYDRAIGLSLLQIFPLFALAMLSVFILASNILFLVIFMLIKSVFDLVVYSVGKSETSQASITTDSIGNK